MVEDLNFNKLVLGNVIECYIVFLEEKESMYLYYILYCVAKSMHTIENELTFPHKIFSRDLETCLCSQGLMVSVKIWLIIYRMFQSIPMGVYFG